MTSPLRLLHAHLRVLALDACASPVTAPAYHLALLGAHLAGLLLVARLAHWPLWAAPLLLLAFSLPQLIRRRWWAESLAPLLGLYGLAALRLVWVLAQPRPVPPALAYEWGLALCAAWAILIVLRCAGRLSLAWIMAGLGAAALFAWQLWRLAPAGVTGSDPFAYVQMALDFAGHGSPLHHFALAPLAARLGLSTLPVTHVGYVLPDPEGWAPTVWPAGYSALLAAAYRVAGARAMITFNVWVALASFAATALLAAQSAPAAWRRARLPIAGAAVAILATSPEQWVRLAVPLADGAAQLFTTAAVVIALAAVTPRRRELSPIHSGRPGLYERFCRLSSVVCRRLYGKPAGYTTPALLGALTGLTLAAAFSVRYTQALVAPGVVLVALWAFRDNRQRLVFVLVLVTVGVLAAAPDLLYRTRLYGAPWRFGTGELALFNVLAVPGAARQLAAELLRPAEWGWLWGLAGVGMLHAWRQQRLGLALMAAAYVPVILFHLLYPFVRARDVLFILAPLAAYSALGGAVLAGALWRRGTAARLAVIAAVLVLGALRLAPLLGRAPGFFTFGGLLPEQRRAFESLADLTEPDAVIAASLNSGAVALYGQRLTVRPGGVLQPEAAWSSEQWLTFVESLHAEGRPLYMLMDSPELEQPLAALQTRYAIQHVADLFVPVYVHTGGSENDIAALWKVAW